MGGRSEGILINQAVHETVTLHDDISTLYLPVCDRVTESLDIDRILSEYNVLPFQAILLCKITNSNGHRELNNAQLADVLQ